MIKEVYTIEEAARLCQTTLWTIHRRIKENVLKGFRAGGGRTFKIQREELLRFMRENGIPIPQNVLPQKNRLLIVDDDEKVSRSLSRYFKTKGFLVETASSGFRAGVLLESFMPRVVLLDIMLGDINGREVLNTICKNAKMNETKVIAISGFVKDEEVQELLRVGFDAYFSKPFVLQTLREKIESFFPSPV